MTDESFNGVERRRSLRLIWDVGLIVRWPLPDKEVYEEKTFTISVNNHGALILVSAACEVGQQLILINPATEKEVKAKVLKVGAPHGGSILVSVEFAEPSNEFWPLKGKNKKI